MRYLLIAFVLMISACSPLPGTQSGVNIVMVGDSVLSWNRSSNNTVGDHLSREIGRPVINFAIPASRISQPNPFMQFTRMQIDNQLDGRAAEWIVMNGGANDVYFECLCLRCQTTVEELITANGTGQLPDLMAQARDTGAKVMYVGYHRTGGLGSAFDRCSNELTIIERRVREFAAEHNGIYYVDMRTVFPPKDRDYYDWDNIHPSPKGSAAIAERLARAMQDAGFRKWHPSDER